MNNKLSGFFKYLDSGVDDVRRLSKPFCESLTLTGFAYVRVYHDGRISWVTSDSNHDRMLVDAGALESDPLVETAELLREGRYLWFHNREFPGCEDFYRIRSKEFGLDHGLVIVNHEKEYLETGAFSGCLSKRPLYNLFMNETELFRAFLEHFKANLTKTLRNVLDEGFSIDDIKSSPRSYAEDIFEIPSETRESLISVTGWSNLLKLSKREKECLALLSKNRTYQEIGEELNLSTRTIEHYFVSVKNKLNISTRAELFLAAQKLVHLGC